MRVLVTGGCGFVGSNLSYHYLESGNDVLIIDNLHRDGSKDNLNWIRNAYPDVIFRNTDVRDFDSVSDAFQDFRPDVAIHLAGQVAMTSSVEDPMRDFRVNAVGTLNILESVRKIVPGCFVIYSSTNKVYGNLGTIELKERETRYSSDEYPRGFSEEMPLTFRTPYGCSKGAAEQYVLDYSSTFGLNTMVFRHSTIYGGRQFSSYDQGWIGWFVRQAILSSFIPDHSFTVSGSGKQVRDILHVNDVAQAYMVAFDHRDAVNGRAFNLGGGMSNSLSILELLGILQEKVGVVLCPQFIEERHDDQKFFVSDCTAYQKETGWTVMVNRERGIDAMMDWERTRIERELP